MDKKTADSIVIQWYSKAKEPSLTYLLNMYAVDDSGFKFYRPFIVAAFMIRMEQKTLIKADVAQWEINKKAFDSLLKLQQIDDEASGLIIPPYLSVENMVIPNGENSLSSGIGLMII